MRDFVHECLYARSGYFASTAERVHRPSAPIRFGSMIGEAEWRQTQASLAAESSGGFLTPVEYFHPWYARALGRFVVAEHLRRADGHETPLRIFELGGGNGTCAAGLLGWLRNEFPQLYETCTYELVEISPTMAARQLARLEEIRIEQEQGALAAEKGDLEAILGSPRRLKRLLVDELAADAEAFGDDRRSPLVAREEARAMRMRSCCPPSR
jgi:hypothetical protein